MPINIERARQSGATDEQIRRVAIAKMRELGIADDQINRILSKYNLSNGNNSAIDLLQANAPAEVDTEQTQKPIVDNITNRINSIINTPVQTFDNALNQLGIKSKPQEIMSSGGVMQRDMSTAYPDVSGVNLKKNPPAYNHLNPLAGLLNLGNSAFETVGAPIGVAIEGYKNAPAPLSWVGKGVEGVMGIPPAIVDNANQVISAVIPDVVEKPVNNFLNKYLGGEATNEAVDKMNKNLAGILAGKAVGNTSASINKGIKIASKNINPTEITKYENIEQGFRDLIPPSTAKGQAKVAANFNDVVQRAIPLIKEQVKKGNIDTQLSALDQLKDAVNKAKVEQLERVNKPISEIYSSEKIKPKDLQINGDEVIKRVIDDIPNDVLVIKPKIIQEIAKGLEDYSKNIPLKEAYQHVTTLNKKYGYIDRMNPDARAKYLASYPQIEMIYNFSKKFKESVFDKVEQLGGKDIREIRKNEGALLEIDRRLTEEAETHLKKDSKSLAQGGLASGWMEGTMAGMITNEPAIGIGVKLGMTAKKLYNTYKNKPTQLAGEIMKNIDKLSASDYLQLKAIADKRNVTSVRSFLEEAPLSTQPMILDALKTNNYKYQNVPKRFDIFPVIPAQINKTEE